MLIRSVLSILGAYVIVALIVMSATMLTLLALVGAAGLKAMRNPETRPKPTPRYLAINLTYSLGAAAVGGYLAGYFAGFAPLGHGAALAMFMVIVGLLTRRGAHSQGQPEWYIPVLLALMTAGTLGGALLHTA